MNLICSSVPDNIFILHISIECDRYSMKNFHIPFVQCLRYCISNNKSNVAGLSAYFYCTDMKRITATYKLHTATYSYNLFIQNVFR